MGDAGPDAQSGLFRHAHTLSECERILTETFGHDSFRGMQKEIVQAAVLGDDVLVVAPTGMGKSLCFQIPALAVKQGVTIVISPLLALMRNQVKKLRELSVPVQSWTSETTPEDKKEIQGDLTSRHPDTRLLYITPESLNSDTFSPILKTLYQNAKLNRLVIDEAHCISEWGHDFREQYRNLGGFRGRFPEVPIMALTASATPLVRDDVVRSLRMEEDRLTRFLHPFNRPNLYYELCYKSKPNAEEQMEHVRAYIARLYQKRGYPCSGIVYCRAKATCNDLTEYLRRKGINARAYHRDIPAATLNKTLEQWEETIDGNGPVDVVVCTIAFGMGIDKPDVRYVIHYDMPKSFEGYYQETGRAGRDGAASKCVLYYSREDAQRVRHLMKASQQERVPKVSLNKEHKDADPDKRNAASFASLVRFAENAAECRHKAICRYFGEDVDAMDVKTDLCNRMCDVCLHPGRTREQKDRLANETSVALQDLLRVEEDVAPPRGAPVRVDVGKKPAYIQPPPAVLNREYPGSVTKRSLNDGVDEQKNKRVRTVAPSSDLRRGFTNTFSSRKAFKPPSTMPTAGEEPEVIEVDTDDDFDQRLNTNAELATRRSPTPTFEPPDQEESSRPAEQPKKRIVKRTGSSHSTTSVGKPSRTSSMASIREETPDLNDDDMMIDLDVEFAFSTKIPVGVRRQFVKQTYETILKASLEEGSAVETVVRTCEDKSQAVESVARTLEVQVFSFSATEAGYKRNCERMKRGIKLLGVAQNEWAGCDEEEQEEAGSALDALRRASSG